MVGPFASCVDVLAVAEGDEVVDTMTLSAETKDRKQGQNGSCVPHVDTRFLVAAGKDVKMLRRHQGLVVVALV